MAILEAGQTINRLTVEGLAYRDKRHRKFYDFLCACGTRKTLNGALVVSGNTKSCGCLSVERKLAQRLPNDRGMINQIILQAKRHARSRGLVWELSFTFVDSAVRKPCDYCGDPAGNIKINRHNPEGFRYNGLDRVDSSLGYLETNVVPCCWRCNYAKGDMPLDEFRAWAKRLGAMAEQWG
jgi:hypothetical protein